MSDPFGGAASLLAKIFREAGQELDADSRLFPVCIRRTLRRVSDMIDLVDAPEVILLAHQLSDISSALEVVGDRLLLDKTRALLDTRLRQRLEPGQVALCLLAIQELDLATTVTTSGGLDAQDIQASIEEVLQKLGDDKAADLASGEIISAVDRVLSEVTPGLSKELSDVYSDLQEAVSGGIVEVRAKTDPHLIDFVRRERNPHLGS